MILYLLIQQLQKLDFRFTQLYQIKKSGMYQPNKYTGYTQKNGAVLIVFTITTAPLFCVCPVY
jgi:hypothetical protein